MWPTMAQKAALTLRYLPSMEMRAMPVAAWFMALRNSSSCSARTRSRSRSSARNRSKTPFSLRVARLLAKMPARVLNPMVRKWDSHRVSRGQRACFSHSKVPIATRTDGPVQRARRFVPGQAPRKAAASFLSSLVFAMACREG